MVKGKDKGIKAELPNRGERSVLRVMRIRAGLGAEGWVHVWAGSRGAGPAAGHAYLSSWASAAMCSTRSWWAARSLSKASWRRSNARTSCNDADS